MEVSPGVVQFDVGIPVLHGNDPVVDSLRKRQTHVERKLLESLTDVVNNYVDPEDAYLDDQGQRWIDIGGRDTVQNVRLYSEEGLSQVRAWCRQLADDNEFAINGHENRISYIVGTGHSYRVTPKPNSQLAMADKETQKKKVIAPQAIIDEFCTENKWHKRQQEIVRRKDRDGECFLRMFFREDGMILIRFIEPGEVFTPQTNQVNEDTFGIRTKPDDVEAVLGYWVNGNLIDASEIQHRKIHVDCNVKRGLPLYYSVRMNLIRAEKLLRNMSAVAEIQSAIAMIRKHAAGTGTAIRQFMQNEADVSVASPRTGTTRYFRHYAPGTILDATSGIEYDFPSAKVDPAVYVDVLQAELRAIASRLVMPEFMLTSDASNANYASTMVAEGPAVKMFERLQHDMVEDDQEIMGRVLDKAVEGGSFDEGLRNDIEVEVTTPRLTTRDRKAEVEADRILVEGKAMSVETWQLKNDLDPEHETALIDAEREKADPFAGMHNFGGTSGE